MTVATSTPTAPITAAAAPAASVTPEHLMDAPLSELLAELGITLSVVAIADPGFCGYILARGESVDTVVVSSAWSELVQDSMARAMLGVALRVPLPPLPEPFTVTELERLKSKNRRPE